MVNTFITLFSQQLTGVIPHGGNNGCGIIYQHNSATNTQKKITKFTANTSGFLPLGKLYEFNSGIFYGFNHLGGKYSSGTLFRYDSKNNSLKDVIHFNGKQVNGLIRGAVNSPNGILYFIGVGSDNQNGTIYAFNPKTNGIEEIFQISSIEDYLPNARIKAFKDGKLYCDYTTDGGAKEKIFVFDVMAKKVVKIIDLPENNRFHFWSSDHKLYSIAHSEIDRNVGEIYLINTSNSATTKIASIDSRIGFHFLSSININKNEIILSSIYSDSYKKGFLLKLNTKTGQTNIVLDFSTIDFGKPIYSLFLNLDGKIHGYSSKYEGNGKGWLFAFDWKKNKMDILTFFDVNQGVFPEGEMVQLNQSKFIGLSPSISTNTDNGAVLIYDQKGKTIKRECGFNRSINGYLPSPFLTRINQNNWIGVAQGGKYNQGVIYKVNKNKHEVLYNFTTDLIDGSDPFGELVKHMNGKFYGITHKGGKHNSGVLYSFDLKTMNTIHHFEHKNGIYPNSICIAQDGRIYGLATYGGINNNSSVFCFNPSTKEFSFFELSRSYDVEDLLIHDEKLYLFEGFDGSKGKLLEFDLKTNRMKNIESFLGENNGLAKIGKLSLYKGIIYGTVSNGGTNGKGILFSYNIKTKSVNELIQFKNTNFSMPTGRPIVSNKLVYFGIKISESKTGIASYNLRNKKLLILKNSESNSGEPGAVFIRK